MLDASGEGTFGLYDPDPISRFDVFDCTTYVETVLALARTPLIRNPFKNQEKNLAEQYQRSFLRIKYLGAGDYFKSEISFNHRNHFASTQWIPNLEAKKIVRDVTWQLDPQGPNLMRAKTLDYHAWRAELNAKANPQRRDSLRQEFLIPSPYFNQEKELAQLPYLSFVRILEPSTGIKAALLKKKILIFNLISGSSQVNEIITHQGFVLNLGGKLFVRHATPTQKKVTTVDFDEYLRERMQDTTVRKLGMNFLEIL